jgi:hypothetical protein
MCTGFVHRTSKSPSASKRACSPISSGATPTTRGISCGEGSNDETGDTGGRFGLGPEEGFGFSPAGVGPKYKNMQCVWMDGWAKLNRDRPTQRIGQDGDQRRSSSTIGGRWDMLRIGRRITCNIASGSGEVVVGKW